MASFPKVSIEVTDFSNPSKIQKIDKWHSYAITHDVFRAANSFTLAVPATPENRAIIGPGGQKCTIKLDDKPQLVGLIDERSEDTSTDNTDLHVSGRDMAGLLLDCVVPKGSLSIAGLTFEQIARKLTCDIWPQYFTGVSLDYGPSRYIAAGSESQKFGSANPAYSGIGNELINQVKIPWGTKIWAVLEDLAKQTGAWITMSLDGKSFCATRPNYGFDPSAYGEGIQLRWDKKQARAAGGNVQGVLFETSIANRCSEYDVGATGRAAKGQRGKQLLLDGGTIKDPSPVFWEKLTSAPWLGDARLYKPGQISNTNCQDIKRLTRLSRREMCEKAIAGFSLEYRMRDHVSPSGAFWTIDSTVNVNDERNGIQGVWYIARVQHRFGLGEGRSTIIKLIPCDLWLAPIDAADVNDDDFYETAAARIWW